MEEFKYADVDNHLALTIQPNIQQKDTKLESFKSSPFDIELEQFGDIINLSDHCLKPY